MSLFLLLEALFKLLDQLLQATKAFDLGLVFLRQLLHKLRTQPVIGNHGFNHIVQRFKILKMQPECPIKPIVVLLVLNQNGAGQRVKIVHVTKCQTTLHCLEQIEELPRRNRYTVVL